MGLSWSSARLIKNGKTLMYEANFPGLNDNLGIETTEAERNTSIKNNNCDITFIIDNDIWLLWKIYKNELKKDGFGMKKIGRKWVIRYYDDLYIEDTIGDEDSSFDSDSVESPFRGELLEVEPNTGRTYSQIGLADKCDRWYGEILRIKSQI